MKHPLCGLRRLVVPTVAALSLCATAAPLPAQRDADAPAPHAADSAPGRLSGRVLDAQTGRALVGAQVVVQGTQRGAASGVDGRYTIAAVPAGVHEVVVSRAGYAAKTVTGVQVPAGGAASIDVTLSPATIALQGITVSAQRERGSVSRALDEQRTSSAVVNAMTAEQIARSPDSDAAAAVQRVSGVTVQDGKFVFVRGLGERYTTTSLNGARIPSPEPEKKVVPLDLFPAGLLQTITTSKTFTPDQPGDFSGAQVNIQTREYPTRRRVAYSASLGYNSAATGRELILPPTSGRDWFALGGSRRALPAAVLNDEALRDPSSAQVAGLVTSFRNAWRTRSATGTPNGSLSLSLGGSDPLFGQRIGYLASATYSASQEVREGEVRAQALAQDQGGTREIDRFAGATGRASVLWGGLLNLSTLLDNGTRLSFNNTYNRSADNEARRERGFSENLGGAEFFIDRLRYVERSVRSHQLSGQHQFGERHGLDWSLTSSGVTRVEPDRSEIVYAAQPDPVTSQPLPPAWFSLSNEGAVRTFGDLRESAREAAANYRFDFGPAANPHRLKLGALARHTARDTENRAYSISATLRTADRERAPEEIFSAAFVQGNADAFRVTPLYQGGSYAAEDRLLAGYALLEYALGERVRLVGGARVEQSRLSLDAQPTTGDAVHTEPGYTDVLPSLALTFQLSDDQNLRLSASQTLSRPEYRELAEIMGRDVLGGDTFIGNPGLRRALIQNFDARWEWYPERDEVFSLALFAKRFQDPIERIYLATSGSRVVTWVNAEAARNYGVELEARKNLAGLADALAPLSVFANATLMQSDIRIGEGAASKTRDRRPMVGQAPYVVNLGLTYFAEGRGASATLLYNRVGERIVSASEAPLPDVYEQARHGLDLSLRYPLSSALALRADAKNLLDAPYTVTQGSVTREHYNAGRIFSLGFSYQP